MTTGRIAHIGVSTFLLATATAVVSLWLFASLPRTTAPVLPVSASGVILWMADASLMTEVINRHPEERQQTFHALMQTWARTAWGPDVSVRYDVLPALGETLIVWDNTTRNWTLRSTVRDTESFLDHLHASYRAGIPPVRRTQRLLDDRFPLDMVEHDEQNVTDTLAQEDGWTLRIMQPTQGSGALASARRGREIIVSNDPATLRHHRAQTVISPAPWRGILAIGSLPLALRQEKIATMLLPDSVLQKGNKETLDPILWSLRRQDGSLLFSTH